MAPPSRREFIGQATVGAAAIAAASRATPQTSPNEKIHLGIIGCGGMGRANLNACAGQSDVVVTGACDVWKARRDAVVAEHPDTCKPYSDFREMLRQPDIDAVIIGTPPHWHCLLSVAAAEAGKDIYVQKPMTLYPAESFAIRNAVRQHDVICQVGTQIHAGANYRRVVELIRSGNLGDIGAVRTFNVMNQSPAGVGKSEVNTPPEGMDWDFWCGPSPHCDFNPILAANAYNHGSWMDYSGGWTPGMAPHIIDLPVWAMDLGFPLETCSTGGRYFLDDDGDAYDNHEVLWRYPTTTMTWMSSLTNSYGFDFHGDSAPRRRLGIYFHGSNGTLFSDYGSHTIIAEGDKMEGMETPEESIPPSPGHEREWLDCIKSREQPTVNADYHVKVDIPVVLSLMSYKLGRSVQFDPETEKVIGDKAAIKMSKPQYRSPWKFPNEYV